MLHHANLVRASGTSKSEIMETLTGVIRLSLGKLLVNLLQVVKQTTTVVVLREGDYPTNTLTNGVVGRTRTCA